MSIVSLERLLNSGSNFITINKDLFQILDIDEALLYSYLVPVYSNNIKKEDYKYFGTDKYILCSVDKIENDLGLSPFRQRNALNKLQKKNLLVVKLGHARTRYVCVNEDEKVLEGLLYKHAMSSIKGELFDFLIKQVEKFKPEYKDVFDNNFIKNYQDEIINSFSDVYNYLSKNDCLKDVKISQPSLENVIDERLLTK